MATVKLTLQYDGTDYAGFQRQPNGVTIQEKLEDALRAVTGDPVMKIGAAAGRTDAGVHARGQVAHFETALAIPADRWPYALNHYLPGDIRAVAAAFVPEDFHARYWAVSKRYRYTIEHAPFESPLSRRYAYHWGRGLDVSQMTAAAGLLQGQHDFAAFRSTGGAAQTSVRTISRLTVTAAAPYIYIDVEADGFLYNMVRIISGTLLEVGAGRRSLDDVRAALANGDRTKAGKTLPPHGLCLEEVHYGDGPKRRSWEPEGEQMPEFNPEELLCSIGIKASATVRRVTGGMDTAIWRVETGSAAYALRVFRSEQACTVPVEAAAMKAAAAASIPVPELHTTGEWQGRPYMLISWCEGQPMGVAALRRPWRFWSAAVTAGRLQARLHRVMAPPEIQQYRNWMDWAKCDADLRATLEAIAVHNETLIHGDFHPMNLMMSGGRVSAVIDWTAACAADPRADVARTMTLLQLAPIFRGWQRALLSPLLRLLAAGWLHGYQQESGPLEEMAPFYVWAGVVLRADMAEKIGRPGIELTEADLRPIDRWTEAWRRRMEAGSRRS